MALVITDNRKGLEKLKKKSYLSNVRTLKGVLFFGIFDFSD
jgi:hypothetical protein